MLVMQRADRRRVPMTVFAGMIIETDRAVLVAEGARKRYQRATSLQQLENGVDEDTDENGTQSHQPNHPVD